jgi:Tfp pilus assembly protein PilV
MVEMLMAAFILAIGVLGLAMLQVVSVRIGTGSRMQNLAIGVGQNILEGIDSEARQQRLFRVMDPGSTAPGLSKYFANAQADDQFNMYGTPVKSASVDPLESAAVFWTHSNCTKEPSGSSAASGAIYSFVVTVHFYDGTNASGAPVERIQTFRRKVSI